MHKRLLTPLAATALLAGSMGLTALPATAAAPAAQPAVTAAQPVRAVAESTINEAIPGVGTFVGSFTPTTFSTQNGQLSVTGLVEGTFTSLTGVATPVSQAVTTVVDGATTSGSCDILHLDLGPLDLNVLGLQVDLNQVVLDITAQRGSGNLLGNLLCAVTGLLDGGNTGGLATLLNRLLGL
jgi:hypothetical protein